MNISVSSTLSSRVVRVSIAGLAVLLLLIGLGAQSSHALTFNPTFTASFSDYGDLKMGDITTETTFSGSDAAVWRSESWPPYYQRWPRLEVITHGADIPIGAKVGTYHDETTIGLFDGLCNNPVTADFDLLNATTDTSVTVSHSDGLVDGDSNGLPDAVDKYPQTLLNRVPWTPRLRLYGQTTVAGEPWVINVAVFDPDQTYDVSAHEVYIFMDPLDPSTSAPSPFTDFCNPTDATMVNLAVSLDNPSTAPDESGYDVLHNPWVADSYAIQAILYAFPDADNDGIDNSQDTCPTAPNVGTDADADGIDAACDPNDSSYNPDQDGDAYLNRQDNCALVGNGTQADGDHDGIGAACDPNDADPGSSVYALPSYYPITITGPSSDTDGDGWDDNTEAYLGTDPLTKCAADTVNNNESPDLWPPDVNDNQRENLSDVVPVAVDISSGTFSSRYDIYPDGTLDVQDVAAFKAAFGQFCTPGTPTAPPTPVDGSFYTYGIDTDATGNDARLSTGFANGLQHCHSVSGIGTSFDVDVYVKAPTPANPLAGYQFTLQYNPSVIQLQSRDEFQLLAQAAASGGPVAVDDTTPDTTGNWKTRVVDLGTPGLEPGGADESGPGVLVRLTFQTVGAGPSYFYMANTELVTSTNGLAPSHSFDQYRNPSIVVDGPCPPNSVLTVNDTGTADDLEPGDGACYTSSYVCTLTAAIEEANADLGADIIHFNIPGGGVHTIDALVGLPTITEAATIDATTQPGYAGTPLIEVTTTTVCGCDGITVNAASTTIKGLQVDGYVKGIRDLAGAVIQGNTLTGNTYGVFLEGPGNLVGGSGAGQGNTISSNTNAGVAVASGTGNTIRANSIHHNGGIGIDLNNDGVTANDLTDTDGGPNDLMNFPLITSVVYNGVQTTITGTLDTSSPATATVDVYSTQTGDPEGHFWLGSATPSGGGAWQLIYSGPPPYGSFTATATDSGGNTSEFTSPAYAPAVGAGLPLTTVVQQGQATPIGGTFSGFGPAGIPNTPGDVVFWATVSGGSATEGIFKNSGGVITKLVAKGEATPLGGTYTAFGTAPVINAAGDISFWASVAGGSSSSAIFKRTAGGVVTKIAAVGDAAPGGSTYTGFTAPVGSATPVINGGGDISFYATLASSAKAIFLYESAEATTIKLAGTGDSAPTGGTFTGFAEVAGYGGLPVVSDNRQVSFWASVSTAAARGVFLWDAGVIKKLAAGGDSVPGTAYTFDSFSYLPVVNNSGQVIFSGNFNAGQRGIFIWQGSSLTKLVQVGDAGPAGVGGTISSIGANPIINGSGEVTVWLGVTDALGATTQDIVRYGSSTNVAAVGNSTPIGGTFSTFIDGTGFPTVPLINSTGQVALWGAVSGGSGTSGIFITTAPVAGTPQVHLGPIENATAPGTGGGKFGPNFDLSINNHNEAVFQDSIAGSQTTNAGVYMFFAGNPTNPTLSPIALQNSPATGGDVYSSFGAPVNDDAGNIAYRATLNGSSDQGLYLFFAGSPHLQARTAPGPTSFASFGDPAIDGSGHVVATTQLNNGTQQLYLFFAGSPLATGGTSDTFGDTYATVANTFGQPSGAGNQMFAYSARLDGGGPKGLYLFFAGAPHRLGRTGVSVGGFNFSDFGDPTVNANGTVVVTGTVAGKQGVYLFTNTSGTPTVTKLSENGQAATGGGTFNDFSHAVETNGSQTTDVAAVSHANVTGGIGEGLFLFFAGSPAGSKIVGPGDHPIENSSLTFGGTLGSIFPYDAMNDSRSIVFVANTSGGSSQGVYFASLDEDSDNISDYLDNCPMSTNGDQANTDQARFAAGYAVVADSLGDACDPDADGDGLSNAPPMLAGPPPVEPTLACSTLPDCDGDGKLDYPEQTPSNCIQIWNKWWTVPAGDTDCDGFPSTVQAGVKAPESFLTTGASATCAANSGLNNEFGSDAWPFDFNDDQKADIFDVSTFSSHFNKNSPDPNYGARWDLNGDLKINIFDVSQYSSVFGKKCVP